MASGTMKDTSRSLTSVFSASNVPYPLPEELHVTIASFLERYDAIVDLDSQRFHDELMSLYTKHVAGAPAKTAPFVGLLTLVRPAVKRWDEWWDLVLKPIMDSTGRKKREIENAKQLLHSLLVVDPDQDKDGHLAQISEQFLQRLLTLYLEKTKIPTSPDDVLTPEDDFVSQQVEDVLVEFGRKDPKALLLAIDGLFVQQQYRTQALMLLTAFLRLQTPHLYLVLETSLIQHLQKCLLVDTSSTVISQALMVLIMFLPHITSALTRDHHLPRLFLIYSRILSWDKLSDANRAQHFGSRADDAADASPEEDSAELEWDSLLDSNDYSDALPSTLIHYYTFLYGLFPLNFMSFIRKPRKFLKSLDFPGADEFDLDQELIHRRTEPYRRVHLLHPNMFTLTIEDELVEHRWLNSEPADIVMECLELCVAVSTTLNDPGPPPASKLPDLPHSPANAAPPASLPLDGSTAQGSTRSWRDTQSTIYVPMVDNHEFTDSTELPTKAISSMSSEAASPLLKAMDPLDSPTLPPIKEKTRKSNPPAAALQRLVIHTPISDRFTQSANECGSPLHAEFQDLSMAALQREIMLLRNDLSFERYLKSQHMIHIGQLQRKHIKEATVEADTQNLINANKSLKARLAKMNEQYTQLKKETLTSRNQSKKWEGELSGKVRSFREEQKVWQGDAESLRFDLQKCQADYERLKQIVEKSEAAQQRAQQRAHALECELEDYGGLRQELETAQAKLDESQNQSRDLSSLLQQRNELQSSLEAADMRLRSREVERDRLQKTYERRILELESMVQGSERHSIRPGQLPPSVQQMLDSALAASQAKVANIKAVYQRQQQQKAELEMSYHELKGEYNALLGRLERQDAMEISRPERDRLRRSFSDRYSNTKVEAGHRASTLFDLSQLEDHEYQDESLSSNPALSPSAIPARPHRIETAPVRSAGRLQRAPGHAGSSRDGATPYQAFMSAQQTQTPVHSSGRSSLSLDAEGTRTEKKVAPKSEVRVFGRGGAQNIGNKKKETKEVKKTGAFRGLRGIVG